MVFAFGDQIEEIMQTLCSVHGWIVGAQSTVGVPASDTLPLPLSGHIDGWLLAENIGLDFKSTNTRNFAQVKKTGDVGDYVYQCHVYMRATHSRRWLLVYVNKDTCQLHEQIVEWDDAVWAYIETSLHHLAAPLTDIAPPRAFAPNEKGVLPWQCSYCDFNKHCWPAAALKFDDKTGKPSLVLPVTESEAV
jgi:hypothetical protein